MEHWNTDAALKAENQVCSRLSLLELLSVVMLRLEETNGLAFVPLVCRLDVINRMAQPEPEQ
jgi:hypothetical protein